MHTISFRIMLSSKLLRKNFKKIVNVYKTKTLLTYEKKNQEK